MPWTMHDMIFGSECRTGRRVHGCLFEREKRELHVRQFSESPRALSSWWVGREHSGAHFLAPAPEPAWGEGRPPAASPPGAEGDRPKERWQCCLPGPSPSGPVGLECLGPGERCRTPLSRRQVPAPRFPADRVRLRESGSSRCGRALRPPRSSSAPPACRRMRRSRGATAPRGSGGRKRGPAGPGAATSPTCRRSALSASQEEDKADQQGRRHQVHHGGHHVNGFLRGASASTRRPGISQAPPTAHMVPPPS